MVVVPAFAERKYSYPKAVFGPVASGKPPRSPHMRRRVHQPGRMQTNDSSKEDAPHHVLPATQNKQDQSQCCNGDPMPFADPEMKLALAQVRNIRQQLLWLVMHGPAGNHPANVRPQAALAGRV